MNTIAKLVVLLLFAACSTCSATSATGAHVKVTCDSRSVRTITVIAPKQSGGTTYFLIGTYLDPNQATSIDALSVMVTVTPDSDWTIDPNNCRTFTLSMGNEKDFTAVNLNKVEQDCPIIVVLCGVDIELAGKNEEQEYSPGAYVGYTNLTSTDSEYKECLVPVKFHCYPERCPVSAGNITIETHNLSLLQKTAQGYVEKKGTLGESQLNGTFYVRGNICSTTEKDAYIHINHSVHKSRDQVRVTVFGAGFTIESENPVNTEFFSDDSKDSLTDNRRALLSIINVSPSSLTGLASFSFSNLKATASFSRINNYSKFEFPIIVTGLSAVTKENVLWYGKNPVDAGERRCCWRYPAPFEARMRMTVDNACSSVTNACTVGMQYEHDRAIVSWIPRYNIGEAEQDPNNSARIRCKISIDGFAVSAHSEVHATNQYREAIEREENYHVKQFTHEVPIEQGGTADLWTSAGILKQMQTVFSVSVFDGTYYYLFGKLSEASDVRTLRRNADNAVRSAAEREEKNSRFFFERYRKGLTETKAKEYAGYNAAFLFHCTYDCPVIVKIRELK